MQQIIDALRNDRPSARVGLLASRRQRQVVEALSGLDWLHVIDKRWFFRHPSAWKRAVMETRRTCYQVAIDASAWHEFSFTHAALTYWSGAPVRIGYRRGLLSASHGDFFRNFYTHLVEPGGAGEYEGRQRMRLLEPLGIKVEPPRLTTRLGHASFGHMSNWLERHCPRRPRVGLWPGGRKQMGRNPPELFAGLGKRLIQQLGAGIVILWGPKEEALRNRLLGLLDAAVAAPPTDLEELAGLLRGLDLVVANDTGPMHLSVAVGTKTLALFVANEASRWGHPFSGVVNLGPEALRLAPESVFSACRELVSLRPT